MNSSPLHAVPDRSTAIDVDFENSAEDPAFTLFAVFRVSSSHPVTIDGRDVPDALQELEGVVEVIEEEGVALRGWYDVSGMRSDADLMVWLHGTAAEDLQWALRELRRSTLLSPLIRTWSAVGVHRDAEFNRGHLPGFVRGVPAQQWLAVYPFVRSPEWYLLPPEDRRTMLAEHGRAGAQHAGVVSNTVSAFALGDYEWLLPMEADDLTELVDMMRDLRGVDARNYVHLETPFYTGRRIETVEIVEVLQ
jgi:chlorite dismutase